MLCSRHFCYQIFHAHKPVIRTFSSWQNSPNIFGTQFSQIPNRNGHCNIPFKSQQLCQRKQLCSNIDEKFNDHLVLATQFLKLDIYNRRKLRLKLEKGRSGQKFFRISLKNQNPGNYINFPNILVPQEIYSFIRAFDELIGEIAAENFEQKLLQIKDSSKLIIEAGNDCKLLNILKLRTVELNGKHQKFELELLFFPNENQLKGQKQICLGLSAIHKITKKGGILTLPLQALPWLRNQMAEMLAKHDGTEEIKEAPAQIPEKFFNMVVTPILPPPVSNGIGHRLNHNEMRPQFVNQRTAYFQQYPKMSNINQNSNQSGIKNQRMFTPLLIHQRPNLKQSEVKKPVKNRTEHLDRQIAALEKGIQTLFDFNEEEMEKFRRIAAKTKNPSKH